MARVLITGLGCVTALGLGVESFLVRSRLWPERGAATVLAVGADVTQGCGWGRSGATTRAIGFPADQIPLLDRFSQFAVLAARQAVADAGLSDDALRPPP